MKRAVVRLTPDVISRLDAVAGRVRAANPGRSCSRAALVRALVAPELATVELDGGKFDEIARRMGAQRAVKGRRS
jgi:hypothetical protein